MGKGAEGRSIASRLPDFMMELLAVGRLRNAITTTERGNFSPRDTSKEDSR